MRNGRITEGEVEKKINGVGQDNIDKTSQEYIAKRDQIVEYLKKGFKNFVIQRELDITPYDFDIFLRDIKYKKIMTSEEIREAREKKRQEDLKFIAKSVEAELTIAQMRDLRPEFSYNEITPMIQELINLGVVTREQVDKNARNAMKKAMNKETKLSPDEQVQFILNKIKKGYSPIEIVESDKTKSLTMHKVLYQKRRLIAKGIISAEEAERAMKKRQEKALKGKHKKIIQKIKEYTELGYKVNEMSEFITEYTYNHLLKIRNDYIKENGWYTNEELKSFSEQRKKREAEEELRKFESLPPEEKKRIEEERRKEAEKAEEEKRKRQEEILAKREEKKKETLRRHLEDANILKEHLKNGNTIKQAATLMNSSTEYLHKIKKESIENGTWFTEEELKEIEKRKLQEQNRKKKKQERNKKRKKAEERKKRTLKEQQRVQQEIRKLRECIENGDTYAEASKNMSYSVAYLQHLKKLAIANNLWFTDDEIKEFKRKRKIREEEERKRAEEEEQARLDKERKERERLEKEEEERIRAFDKERKRKIRGFSKEYKEYRREAKKEDKDELNGEENISAEGRKKFIEVLIKLHNLDADIPEKDIEIVLNVIHIHPEIVRKDIIKFLILDANKRGGAKSAEKMISELTDILMYTPYYSTLIEYRKWLKAQRLFPKIKAMKEKGMSNTDIGNKLGITSVEVINIFYGHEKKEALGDAEK